MSMSSKSSFFASFLYNIYLTLFLNTSSCFCLFVLFGSNYNRLCLWSYDFDGLDKDMSAYFQVELKCLCFSIFVLNIHIK